MRLRFMPIGELGRRMGRSITSRFLTNPARRRTRALLNGTVVRIYATTADVRMQDGSVLNMPVPDAGVLASGDVVRITWGEDSSPLVVSGGGANGGGSGAVSRLVISDGTDTSGGELGHLLPDYHNIGVAMAASVLNKQLADIAMPSTPLYAGLLLSYTSDTIYTEATSATITNCKRAVVPRTIQQWPLITSGEVGKNGINIGIEAAGSGNSFLASGSGCALTSSGLTIAGVAFFDSPTGGNYWFGGRFAAPMALKSGDIPGIASGTLSVGFSNSYLTQFEKRNFLNVALNNMDYVRNTYSIRLLVGSGWNEPTAAQWANYKPAVVYRDSTTFPPTTGKSIKNGIVIGGGAGGTGNSFLASGESAYISGGSLGINAVGIYDHQGYACWRVPFPNNETKIVLNGATIFIDVGKLLLKIS